MHSSKVLLNSCILDLTSCTLISVLLLLLRSKHLSGYTSKTALRALHFIVRRRCLKGLQQRLRLGLARVT